MALSSRRRRPRRWLRIVLGTIGALILVAVVGIAAFVATFDPNSYKPQIVAAVRSATGRTLTLNGHIGLSLSLQPTLAADDVALSNPPGFSRPQMVSLQRLELRLALLPLLSRQVRIERLVLVHPNILLETNAQGRSNWQMAPPGAAAQAAGGGEAAAPAIALSSLRIENGTLAIRDADGTTTALGISSLDATEASPDAPMHLTASATYNGAKLQLTADTGSLARLQDNAATTPWPVKLVLSIAGATVNADGSIARPIEAQGVTLHVRADVPDLAALTPLAGTALPALKTIALQCDLVSAKGGNGFAINGLKLTMPQLDLSGNGSIARGAPPLLTADLLAKRIDLDALSAALVAPPAGGGHTAAPAAARRYVIPDTKLPFGALGLLDADLRLSADALTSQGVTYKAVKLHAVDKHGVLTVDPFGVEAPGGAIDGKLTVDSTVSPPRVAVTLRAPGLALQPLLKALGRPGYASGNLEVRADLRGQGDSPHAIAASMDGAIGLALAKGQIDSRLLGGMMASLVRQTQIANLATKAGMSDLNCFALRMDATKGVGTLRALKLDSSTMGLDGTGDVDFGGETLDLHLKPAVGVAGTNITAPVIVGGTFADPSVHPDTMGLVTGNVGTAAKMALGASTAGIGLIIGSAIEQKLQGDVCAAPLALARFVQPPPAAQRSGTTGGSQSSTPTQSAPAGPLGTLKKLFQ